MPRKNKSGHKIGPLEEAENAKALDAAAGVASPEIEVTRAAIPPVAKRADAPLLVADTREKLLYRCALQGPGISAEFFKEFTDTKELAELTLMLTLRRMAKSVANPDADEKDVLACARVLLNIVYGENASTDPNKFLPQVPTVPAIPTGATEQVDASVTKFRKFSGQ